MICSIHNVPMEEKTSKTKFDEDGNPKKYFCHFNGEQICFGDKGDKPTSSRYTPYMAAKATEIREKLSPDSMLRCNAMNNAVAIITADKDLDRNLEDLKDLYTTILSLLEGK